MKALQEFKAFAMKGNVVDMAVGVVIGAGFGKIVSSLVADILTPVLGLLIGGVNFSNLKVTLREAAGDKVPAVTWNYGSFIQTIFDFLIIAWAIFVLVKLITRLQRQPPPAPAVPPPPGPEVVLLTEIRDALKAQNAKINL
ncbi:MAG: large-conductance mechanosensitive channel [Pseudomonadota bacterium]|jgi:large conductance mechanosensitive channel